MWFADKIACCFCVGYIDEVEHSRQTSAEEAAATEFLASGSTEAKGIVELLHKVNKPNQMPIYYSGGLSIIKQMLQDSQCISFVILQFLYLFKQLQCYLLSLIKFW